MQAGSGHLKFSVLSRRADAGIKGARLDMFWENVTQRKYKPGPLDLFRN
jgi:hypothetical protein